MKIENKKEIELSIDDVTEAIIKYLNILQDIPLDSEFKIDFKIRNKPIPHPTYFTDTIDHYVFDGVKVMVKT
jgi:hypothetical protein